MGFGAPGAAGAPEIRVTNVTILGLGIDPWFKEHAWRA
jgi:hypothetical protein